MIKQIRLTNFYSFKDVSIDLQEGTTVMVGINGSGKSNLIKAINLLKEGIAGKENFQEVFISQMGGFDEVFYKGEGENEFPNSIGLKFVFSGPKVAKYGFNFFEDISYEIFIIRKPGGSNFFLREKLSIERNNGREYLYLEFYNGKGVLNEVADLEDGRQGLIRYEDKPSEELVLRTIFDSDRYYPLYTIRQAISNIAVYEYFNTTSQGPMRRAVKATSEKRLLSDGSNLAQIINTIKITHKPSFRKLEETLRQINEHFQGFDFRFLGSSGTLELLLDESNLLSPVHVTHLSDGTLRFLCLLAILFNPDRGSFICIDEPEVGLHPDMLTLISNIIQEASEDTQVLLATHSENILNQFNVDDLRVFEKDEDNSTCVTSYNESDFEGWYDTFSPGQMWRSGELGGNRY